MKINIWRMRRALSSTSGTRANRYAELTSLLRLIDTFEGAHPEMSLAYPRPSTPTGATGSKG
jgi:hypothetical protein